MGGRGSSDGGAASVIDAQSTGVFDPKGTRPESEVTPALALGKQPVHVGRFVVLRPLGQGGMGRVYAAYDEELDRRVAVKVLRRVNAVSRERVRREAQAMAKLSHPNVVQVFEVGEHDGSLFIAMEFAEGGTLDAWQKARGRTWRDVLGAYLQAGEGLAAAHAAGIVHRDFKPANATVASLTGGQKRVRVFDFGLALRTGHTASLGDSMESEEIGNSVDMSRLTADGRMVGTPAFMAPEQFGRESVTDATDQFSFCIALWEGLYGQLPFAGTSLKDRKAAVQAGELRKPPRESDVPGWLRAVLERGLSTRPEDRYPRMHALLEALRRDPAKRRRRWLWGAAGLTMAVAGGAAAQSWVGTGPKPCSGGEQELAGVWDDARRTQAHEAMLGTRRSYAPTAWEHVQTRLDRYAEEWLEAYAGTCEATTVRQEQSTEVMDLRMACLHRAKMSLAAVATVLVDADPQVVDNATKVTGGLTPLDRCADIEALLSDVDPPPADEAKVVEQLRRTLAAASVERKAARYPPALAHVEEAKALLGSVSYGPVRTEVASEEGRLLQDTGDFEGAQRALRAALKHASAWDQRDEMQAAATRLLFVVGYAQQRMAEGLHYRELAEGLARSPENEAGVRTAIAAVQSAQGQYVEAEAEYRKALDLYGETAGGGHLAAIQTRANLAALLILEGKSAEAEAELRQVLELRVRALGAEHPEVAGTRDNLGSALARQGKYEAAEAEHRRALAAGLEALGPEHPDVAGTRSNLAGALEGQGEFEEAEAEFRRVVPIWKKTLGPDHPDVALSQFNLAGILAVQGKLEEAEPQFREALQLWEKTLGGEHPYVAGARTSLAALLLERGNPAEALALAERAWALQQRDDIPADERGRTGFALAKALWLTGADGPRRQRARDVAQRALEAYTLAGKAGDAQVAEVQAWIDAHPRP